MKKRKAITGTLVSAALLALALALYAVWYAAVARHAAEAAALRVEQLERSAAGGRAAQARRALESLEGEEARVYAHLVSPDDIVPFLESLESVGEGLGTQVDVVSVGGAPAGAGRITLSLRVTGTFEAVMRTLGAIEYQPYDVRLSSLTLDTPTAIEANAGTWTAAAVFSLGMQTASTTPRTREAAPESTEEARPSATGPVETPATTTP